MTVQSKRKRRPAKMETLECSSTLVGASFTMPDKGAAMSSFADEAPIDFQARQDSIAPARRDPGEALAPKLKRTTIKPSKAEETRVKI